MSKAHTTDTLWLIALASAVFLVYGSSLSYPFFWVDPIDIGLAGSRDLATILTSSQGYLYYRPFAFLLWKALHAVSGRFDPFAFHLAQMLTHALNAWLLYALTRRILHRHWLAGLAALLFAWYPASFQTVTWVISPQVQATAFLLASAILYYDGRVASSRRKLALSLACLAIALPFHENAVSFGFIIAGLEIYLALNPPPNHAPTYLSRWPATHVVLCLAFAVLWFIIPKDPDSAVTRFEPAAGWYLLQGLIWPVAGAVGPWREWLPGPAWQPLILVAPPTLFWLLVAYARSKRASLLALGLLWFGVMVLPIWATRGIDYVGISPRIFYVAAPGAILIWVGLLSLKFQSNIAHRVWRIAAGILIAAVVLQSIAFLAVRKDLQDKAMPAIWDVVRSSEQAGSDATLLYVNVPDQITPRRREYPVGFFRAVLMPVSVDLGQYAELQTGTRPATRSLAVPSRAGLDDYPYQVDMRGQAVEQAALSAAIREADAVFLTAYSPDGRIRVTDAGAVAMRPAASEFVAVFDNRLQLTEARLDAGSMRLTLVWQCLGNLDAQDTIFVHLNPAGGQPLIQADGDPLRGLFPLAECRPGEQIRDVRVLPASGGPFILTVGVYNRATGNRLNVIDLTGTRFPDDAVILPSPMR